MPSGYPAKCSYKSTPRSSACNEALRVLTGTGMVKPARLYLYHELDDWLATLFSRKDIETLLDRDLDDRNTDTVWDIWDATELQSFLGPEHDPSRPFIKKSGDECRLVFSLNMDGFNPFTNKEAGKVVSTGAIYMICLNLPVAIRHDLENMFLVGVIPGPDHPSTDQINPLLRPLVEDLLQLWDPGVFLTATATYPHGRLVRGALIPVICDLPAARQIGGFASHSSNNQCSICLLKADEIDNLDPSTWPMRTVDEHREVAQAWLDAPTDKKRAELFESFGVRWSELLRLPYWDPINFLIIDSMHGFFLRLFQRHCRQIWGMDIKFDDCEFPSFDEGRFECPDDDLKKAQNVLRRGSDDALRKLPLRTLRALTRNLDPGPEGALPHGYAKKAIIKNLLRYRVHKRWFDEEGNKLDHTTTQSTCAEDSSNQSSPSSRQGSSALSKGKASRKEPPTDQEMTNALSCLLTGTKSRLRKLRKQILVQLCQVKDIAVAADVPCTVKDLLELLEQWRIQAGIVDRSGNLLVERSGAASNRKGTKVLGRETLRQIHSDIQILRLPSWVSPAPRQPGVAKFGKFTADQWRSFCTYNLVFTLIRLWGAEPEGSQKRGMLDNFLQLVTAVKLASMRSMTEDRIRGYADNMHAYLDTLRDLFKGTTLTPYQHLSLHFPSFLRRFGPTHSWRCFTFERYNFLLQNIPTNMKFGEMEKTMLKRFCMGQNLRTLFKPEELPPHLHELITLWERSCGADIRGTLKTDSFTFDVRYRELPEQRTWKDDDEMRLPPDWFSILRQWVQKHDQEADPTLLSPFAYVRTKVERLGELYHVESKSAANSYVYFAAEDGTPTAGSIQAIFSHTRGRQNESSKTETFFILKRYKPLPPQLASFDHYRRYPLVAGRLYQESTYQQVTIINGAELLYHFGYGRIFVEEIGLPTFAAIPLDRS
ncbi:hypothetical protein NLJ89_g10940 [Agrocybe chaxingu]|uniref:Uncharacterized protein n=1 Tax=Agrocybe chaxingu TaxID=84603 RepID=A0A9W8JQV4_9AGAR|nr:hypothetical protein NLJ89_g10940 [Agrocybe chaxingu]